jgi:hypothetical protein
MVDDKTNNQTRTFYFISAALSIYIRVNKENTQASVECCKIQQYKIKKYLYPKDFHARQIQEQRQSTDMSDIIISKTNITLHSSHVCIHIGGSDI